VGKFMLDAIGRFLLQ